MYKGVSLKQLASFFVPEIEVRNKKVREKRIETGIKQPSKVGKDRVHLLSGILKCPDRGRPMYTNKHAWTNKDGTYKEVYYYVCSPKRAVRGRSCTYKAMLKKTEIEPLFIEAIKELVSNKTFAKEVKSRIGTQIDTTTVDREIKNYESKLLEVDLNKARLEDLGHFPKNIFADKPQGVDGQKYGSGYTHHSINKIRAYISLQFIRDRLRFAVGRFCVLFLNFLSTQFDKSGNCE
ncbi:zinc ribbon domain-containing protein [Clostridium sp. D2Q-14]|uniref:zinc ribbon domain-containing protein n=1 Tax=Anaeromonas gelatinilytica TaxID=2683194 RepID=UPI00193BD3ED|nr:zinc ribbon domain-containing protein [Anaeromonas gelatinilytica]